MNFHRRVLRIGLGVLLASCATREATKATPGENAIPAEKATPVVAAEPPAAAEAGGESDPELLTAESQRESTRGTATFNVPAGWYVQTSGDAVRLIVPERDGEMALVDLDEPDSDRAIARAWKVIRPDFQRAAKAHDAPGRDGWDRFHSLVYQVAPEEKRVISATALHAGKRTLVQLLDLPVAVLERRSSELGLIAISLKLKAVPLRGDAGRPGGTP